MSPVPPSPSLRAKLTEAVGNAATALVVLAVGSVLSVAAAYWMSNQVEREARLKFENAVADAHDAIESRIRSYSEILVGVRGLFAASTSVSRADFRDYVDSLDLKRRYPGIVAVHYAQRVTAGQKQAFEAAVRNDTSVDPRGYPEFAVKPPGDRPEYVVVQYIEPFEERKAALGVDQAGEAVRLAALERTRDSNRITASGNVALALDPRNPPGFLVRLAVYRKGMPIATVEQRREAFTGMVGSAFIMIDLMRGVLSEQFLHQTHVRIHDAGFLDGPGELQPPAAENLMFDSDGLLAAPASPPAPHDGKPEDRTSVSVLDVGGRRWNLYISARQAFVDPYDRWLPAATLLGGVTISLLLFGLMRSLATVGRRATTLAASITEDLRQSEVRLARSQRMTQELIEVLPNPVYFKGVDGRYLGVNKAWEDYFGMQRQAFLGKTVHDLYRNHPEVAARLHADDQLLWEHPGAKVYETSITTPDGQRHDAVYYKATFTHADGSVAGLIGTVIDITERKRAERELQLKAELTQLLEALARAVNEAATPQAALQACLACICEHGNWTLGHVAAFAPGRSAGLTETSFWHQRDPEGSYAEFIGYSDRLAYNVATGRFTGVALREKRPVWIEDLSRLAGSERHAVAVEQGLRTGLTFPVILNGEPAAFLEFFADEPRPPNAAFLEAISTIASQLSRVIERERALNALRESEHLLRLVTEGVPAMIAYFDAELRCRFANAAYREFHHLDPQGVIGMTLREIAGDDTYRVLLPTIDLVKDGMPVTLRRQERTATGEIHHIEIHRVPDMSPEGEFRGYYAMVLDITEQVRAEEVRAQLAAIVENSGDAIWSRSLDGKFLSWNAAATRLFGWTREEVIGRDGISIVPPERLHERGMVRARLMHGEDAVTYETIRLRKDGTPVEVEARASAIRDADGKLTSVAVIMHDIGERKRAEEVRSELEVQLREAQKLEAIGTLAGGIAHDFNNILGAIIGNAALAQQDVGAGHRALVSLEEIYKASQRAKSLVQQILAFGRKQPQQTALIALRPVVEDAVKLLRATLPAGVELAAAISDSPLHLHGDATQIQQVLLNLCTNAWHAMEGQAGRIEIGLDEVVLDAAAVSTLPGLQPGRHARLRVSDNGKGMDAATQAHIFEPFFTTKPVGQGTGLGLSVVHGIIKAHHGAISLHSAPGEGTTFQVYFPAAAAPRAETLPEPTAPGSARGSGQHVLYVDDDEAMVFLVTRMLEGLGYRVSGYERAAEALEAVRADAGDFDLAVTDFNMPGLSGLEVAQELARIRPDLPVVITSGYITEELRTNALQAGARHVVYKPNTIDELCQTIQRLLATAGA